MLCGRTFIRAKDVRAAVVEKKQMMAETFRRLSSIQGRGLFRIVLNYCLDLGRRLGFRTSESSDGRYGVCETGEGDRTIVINIHLGRNDLDDAMKNAEDRYYVGPVVSILYSLKICMETGCRVPFRIKVCLMPEEDGFLEKCVPITDTNRVRNGSGMRLVFLEQVFPHQNDHSWCNCVIHTDSEFKALQIAEEAANYAQQMEINLIPSAEGDLVRIDSFGGGASYWSDPWVASDASVQLSGFLSTLPICRKGLRHHSYSTLNADKDCLFMLYALRDSVCELAGKGEIWRSYDDVSRFILNRGSNSAQFLDMSPDVNELLINWSLIYTGAFLRLAGLY